MNLKWDTDDKVVLQIIKALKSIKQGWCIIFSTKGQMVSIFEFVSFWSSVTTVQLFVIAPKQLYTVNKGLNVCVCESRSVMSDSLQPHGLYSSRNSPDQYTGVGSLSLLQRIFPTQESPALQVDSLPTELSGKPTSDVKHYRCWSTNFLLPFHMFRIQKNQVFWFNPINSWP